MEYILYIGIGLFYLIITAVGCMFLYGLVVRTRWYADYIRKRQLEEIKNGHIKNTKIG